MVDGLVTSRPPQAGYPAERYRAEAGVLDGVRLLGSGSIADRVWAGPAATVLAIDAPPVSGSSNALTSSALGQGEPAHRAGRRQRRD